VLGSANDDNFEQYTLAIANGHVAQEGSYTNLITSGSKVVSGTLFNWTELPVDGRYTLELVGQDLAGNTARLYRPINIDTQPPAKPELTSVATTETKVDIDVQWLANTEQDLAGYNLYQNGSKVNADLLTELSFLDTGLSEGEYSYTVTAVDLAGLESEQSNSRRMYPLPAQEVVSALT